jgi:hypothetical protein
LFKLQSQRSSVRTNETDIRRCKSSVVDTGFLVIVTAIAPSYTKQSPQYRGNFAYVPTEQNTVLMRSFAIYLKPPLTHIRNSVSSYTGTD